MNTRKIGLLGGLLLSAMGKWEQNGRDVTCACMGWTVTCTNTTLKTKTFWFGRILRIIVQITVIGALVLWVVERRIAQGEPPCTFPNALVAIAHWVRLTQKTGDGAAIARARLVAIQRSVSGITLAATPSAPGKSSAQSNSQTPGENSGAVDPPDAPPEPDNPAKPTPTPVPEKPSTPGGDVPPAVPKPEEPIPGPTPSPPQPKTQITLPEFLMRKDITDGERRLMQDTRAKLGFPGKRDATKMAEWASDPDGKKGPIAGEFRSDVAEYLRRHYLDLRQKTHALVIRWHESFVRYVPESETDALLRLPMGRPPTFTVVRGMPVEILQHLIHAKPPLVQVASQFNSCESPGPTFSELTAYPGDRTQGPGASLTALTAASLRIEACRIYQRDTMQECLARCVVITAAGEKPICEVYPTLCQNGYFQPHAITDPQHLLVLAQWLRTHTPSSMLQWVECEESGAIQLQTFSAAASFQGQSWGGGAERRSLLRDICEYTLVGQYRALARVVAHTGQDLHLTLVGMGAFNNPRELVPVVLRAVAEELAGTGVRVFLHAYGPQDAALWSDAMRENGLSDAGISLV
jgi:outer membrane biosynthesis protein TonB